VHAVVVDASGGVIATAGNTALETYWRSCAKPFQVMPLVADGGLDRIDWGDDELVLACASHGGEPEHVAIASRMLATIGLDEGDLACGPSDPLSRRGLQLLRESGGQVTRLHNNCSGKHAAMLARALHCGWPTHDYQAASHPVQREALAQAAHWTRTPAERIAVGIDGCGVSVFGVPLHGMALAYAQLADQARRGEGAAARIVRSIAARPFLIGGTDRFDTVLAMETGGTLIAKVGAEGVHCVAIPERGWGVAIKVEDGALRAQHVAVVAALQQLGLLSTELPPGLQSFAVRPVKNTRGEIVGEVSLADET
jgi:L-asparaginase II